MICREGQPKSMSLLVPEFTIQIHANKHGIVKMLEML